MSVQRYLALQHALMLNCPDCGFRNYADAVECFGCGHNLKPGRFRRASQVLSRHPAIGEDQTEDRDLGEATTRPSWAKSCPKCNAVVQPFRHRCPGCETRLTPSSWRRKGFLTVIVFGITTAVVISVGAWGLSLALFLLLLASGAVVASKPSGIGSYGSGQGYTFNIARGDGSGSDLTWND